MYEQRPDFEQDLADAKDPAISSKLLSHLLDKHFGELTMVKAVASNPACAPLLFCRLYCCDPTLCEDNPDLEGFKSHPQFHQWTRRIGYDKYSRRPPHIADLRWILKNGDTALQRRLMAIEDIPEAEVRTQAKSKSAPMRKVVAARQTAPSDVYERLAQDSAKTVRLVLAANAAAPPEVLTTLANDSISEVAKAARDNPSCPDDVVHAARLADAAEPATEVTEVSTLALLEAAQLAGDPDTSPETLGSLSSHHEPCVRYVCGFNPRTPADALERLADDAEAWVQASAAYNPKTPQTSLSALQQRKEIDILQGLASNPALSETEQLKLAENAPDTAALSLANLTQHASVWKKLTEDLPSAKTAKQKTWRHYLAEIINASGPRAFTGMTQGPKSMLLCVARAAARSEHCPDNLLGHYAHYLFDDYRLNTKGALALLEGASHVQATPYRDWKVDMWLSECRPPGHVAQFFIQSDDAKRRAQAVSAPTTERVYLLPFVVDDNTLTRKRLAQRTDVHRFFCEMLLRDSKSGVREAMAKNRQCPKALLKALKNEKETTVRMAANRRSKASTRTPSGTGHFVNQGSATERARLAKNSEDPALLTELAADRAASVRREVVENSYTPKAIVDNYAGDPDMKVRAMVARRTRNLDVIETLLQDTDQKVRLNAAGNSQIAPYDRNSRERQWNQELLLKLLRSEDELVRAKGAENIESQSQRTKLMDDTPEVTRRLARNKHLSAEEKIALAKRCDDQDTLAALAYRTDNEELFLIAAQKITSSHADDPIRCHNDMLARHSVQDVLCHHPLASIRMGVARNKPLSTKAAKALADDADPWIKRSLR